MVAEDLDAVDEHGDAELVAEIHLEAPRCEVAEGKEFLVQLDLVGRAREGVGVADVPVLGFGGGLPVRGETVHPIVPVSATRNRVTHVHPILGRQTSYSVHMAAQQQVFA